MKQTNKPRVHGKGETPEERFWSRVAFRINPSKCWEWTGIVQQKTGYGKVGFRGLTYSAHRLAWYFTRGSVPKLSILHSCDNRLCVNPNHLREGTQKENIADMHSRGRAVGNRKKGM